MRDRDGFPDPDPAHPADWFTDPRVPEPYEPRSGQRAGCAIVLVAAVAGSLVVGAAVAFVVRAVWG